MSPARQPNGSPGRKKVTRPTPFDPVSQPGRSPTVPTGAEARRDVDPQAFLATISEGRKLVFFLKKQTIFAQGDSADAVFYLQTGKVKLTVVSKTGKEATLGIFRRRKLLRGRGPSRPISPHGHGDRIDGLRCSANRQEGHDGSPARGKRLFRLVRGVFAGAEHS
jgi:CRP-like cAMP-binding protein